MDRYVNGVLSVQASSLGASKTPDLTDERYTIGSKNNLIAFADVYVFEIIVYAREITDAEINILLKYLSEKYDISVTYL